MEKTLDKIVALAKNRGFVYPGSEIYGGLANTWDYGNYVTLKALEQGTVDNQLIRYAFEVRLMDIEGQGIHAYTCVRCNKKELKYFNAKAGGLLCEACGKELKLTRTVSETLIYTLQYIQSADLTKLYAFQLSEEAMAELKYVADRFREAYIDREFKSLEILSSL